MRSVTPWTEAELLAAADELDQIRERVHTFERLVLGHSRLTAPEYRAAWNAARYLLAVRSKLENTALRRGFAAAAAALTRSTRGVPVAW
jgi:hypothetical protein